MTADQEFVLKKFRFVLLFHPEPENIINRLSSSIYTKTQKLEKSLLKYSNAEILNFPPLLGFQKVACTISNLGYNKMATFWSPTTKAVVLAESPALDILNAEQIKCVDSAGGALRRRILPGRLSGL